MTEIMKCECGKEYRFLRGKPTRGKNTWKMEYRCTDLDCLRLLVRVEKWVIE